MGLVALLALSAILLLSFGCAQQGQPGAQTNQQQADARLLASASSTFAYGGVPGSERLVANEAVSESRAFYKFEFESLQAGYGNRPGQAPEQVTARHTTVIEVEGGIVASSITDGKFDELNGRLVSGRDLADAEFGQFCGGIGNVICRKGLYCEKSGQGVQGICLKSSMTEALCDSAGALWNAGDKECSCGPSRALQRDMGCPQGFSCNDKYHMMPVDGFGVCEPAQGL